MLKISIIYFKPLCYEDNPLTYDYLPKMSTFAIPANTKTNT